MPRKRLNELEMLENTSGLGVACVNVAVVGVTFQK